VAIGALAAATLPFAIRVLAGTRSVVKLHQTLAQANPGAAVWTGLALPGLGTALAEIGIPNHWPDSAPEDDQDDAPDGPDGAGRGDGSASRSGGGDGGSGQGDRDEDKAEALANSVIGVVVASGFLRLLDRHAAEVASFPVERLAPAVVRCRPDAKRPWRERIAVVLRLADGSADLPFTPGAPAGPPLPRQAPAAAEAVAEFNQTVWPTEPEPPNPSS
jgi:hypothetical protein